MPDDRLFLRRSIVSILLLVLCGFVVFRGLVPAFTRVDTDFPNYYVAGKIAASGTGVERLYDDAWFQDQTHALGIDFPGRFSPFPPVTALIFIPFSPLESLTALRVLTAMNIIFLCASIFFLSRIAQLPITHAAVPVLLSGTGLANCFRFGQLYIALSFFIILGTYFYTRKKPVLAGICFGILAPVKYFPVVFLIYFAATKQWRLVLSSAATMALVCITGIAVLGWTVHQAFLLSVAGPHLLSMLPGQDPFSATFQSFDSLLHRLFLYDALLNPSPFADSPLVYSIARVAIPLALTASLVLAIVRARRRAGTYPDLSALGLVGIAGLLVAPATATYHFVLLWLPVTLLVCHARNLGRPHASRWALGVYACIGFIPYSFFHRFDGMGLLTLVAYPRLILTCALFAVGVKILALTEQPRDTLRSIP